MSETWLVAHFKAENTVEVIPKQWYVYESEECFWPSGKYSRQKVNDFIRNLSSPECDWKIYPAKVLGEYDSYEKAHKKANKATYTDRLSSSNNEIVFSAKRKKCSNRRHSSTSLTDEDEYPVPPKSQSLFQKNTTSQNTPIISTPVSRRDILERNTARNESAIITPSTAECFDGSSTSYSKPTIDKNVAIEDFIKKSEEFQRQVLRQLIIINTKLNQHSDNFDTLLSAQNVKDRQAIDTESTDELNIFLKSFPLQSLQNLNELELWLQTENNVKFLAKELSRIGGDNVKEITKRIMYNLLSNDIGVSYSWEGAKGKKMFKNLKIASVIIHAVRYNSRTQSAQDDEIIKIIKAWLLRAKDRLENSRKRNASPKEQTHHEAD